MLNAKLAPEDVRPPPKGMMLLVLRAIAVLGGDVDTFDIRDYIGRIIAQDIPTAQIAIMLLRLERRDFVSSRVSERDSKPRRGRPRKVYDLTPGGKLALEKGMRLFTNSDIKGKYDVTNGEEQASTQTC